MLDTAQNIGAAINHSLYSQYSFVYPQGDVGEAERVISIKGYPLAFTEVTPAAEGGRKRIAPWVQKNRRVHGRRRACMVWPEGFWL